MKIIPHPALLKQRQDKLDKIQNDLSQKERELHILEIMLNSRIESEKRQLENKRISFLGFFLAGLISGFLASFFIS